MAESPQEFGSHHVTKGLGRITEGVMTKGSGSYVDFKDGRRMLDFTSGIGVTNLGEYLLCALADIILTAMGYIRTLPSESQSGCC